MARLHDHAGVYDSFGRELTFGHHNEKLALLLGDEIFRLAQEYEDARVASLMVQGAPEHQAHVRHKEAKERLDSATHGRLSGLWGIDRYNDPIEYYAYCILNNVGYGQHVDEASYAGLEFHKLPAAVREAADKALKASNPHPLRTEFAETFENLFMTQGVSTLWNQAANGGTTNSGASVPGIKAWYNNAQAVLGVGDSSTAAANTQFDLQAASNRLWVAMDATFPTLPGTGSNSIVFRATFASAQANYAWNEFAIANDNGSNVTIPGSAARSASNGSMLDRVVSAQGTKASGQTWQPSMTLSIS